MQPVAVRLGAGSWSPGEQLPRARLSTRLFSFIVAVGSFPVIQEPFYQKCCGPRFHFARIEQFPDPIVGKVSVSNRLSRKSYCIISNFTYLFLFGLRIHIGLSGISF